MRLSVKEGLAGGEQVIGYIKACDKDEPPNDKIYYHLVSCKYLHSHLILFLTNVDVHCLLVISLFYMNVNFCCRAGTCCR